MLKLSSTTPTLTIKLAKHTTNLPSSLIQMMLSFPTSCATEDYNEDNDYFIAQDRPRWKICTPAWYAHAD